MIQCKICKREFKLITISHLNHHDITINEYKNKYGDKLSSLEFRVDKAKYKEKITFDWTKAHLGSKPDSAIAEELNMPGVDRHYIMDKRNELGIKPFSGYLMTQEGNACRSIYEAKYDAYLHENNIQHKHEVLLKDLGLIADFKINGQIVEIAGMYEYFRYRKRHEKKKKIYDENNINVKWLYAKDVDKLYKNCKLPLRIAENRICKKCGKKTHDLINGICGGSCYMKEYRNKHMVECVCKFCGNKFQSADIDRRNYCSQKCYWDSMATKIDLNEVKKEMETKSIRKIAMEKGINYGTLLARVRGWRKDKH